MPIKREVKYRARSLGRALQIGPSGRQSSERPAVLRCPLRAHVGEPGVLSLGSDPAPGRSRHSRPWTPSALVQVFSRWKGLSSPPPCKAAGEASSRMGRRGKQPGVRPAGAGIGVPRGLPHAPTARGRRGGRGRGGAGRGRLRVRAALAVFNLVRRARISGAQRLPMTPSAFVV